MKTLKISTRFMNGNLDVENVIFDILCDNYSKKEVFESIFGNDDIIYSDGFILAIENGLIPDITRVEESFETKKIGEYHHIILNDKCFSVYFN